MHMMSSSHGGVGGGVTNIKSAFADKTKLKRKSTTFLIPYDYVEDECGNDTSCKNLNSKLKSESNSPASINNKQHSNSSNEPNVKKLIYFKKSSATIYGKFLAANSNSNATASQDKKMANEEPETKYRPSTPKLFFNYFPNKSNQLPSSASNPLSRSYDSQASSQTSNIKSKDSYFLNRSNNSNDLSHLLTQRLPRITKVAKENLLTISPNKTKNQLSQSQSLAFGSTDFRRVFFPLLVRNQTSSSNVRGGETSSGENSARQDSNFSANVNGNGNRGEAAPNRPVNYFDEAPLGLYFVQNISNLNQI